MINQILVIAEKEKRLKMTLFGIRTFLGIKTTFFIS